MKYAIIIPAGVVDEQLDELHGRTPLQAALLPTLDRLAATGRLGSAFTIPPGFPADSVPALLGILGYDPRTNAAARGPLEALARGLTLEPGDQVFRCNLVTVTNGHLADFTAGYIGALEAERLIDDLNEALEQPQARFVAGRSFRHLFAWTGAGELPDLNTTEPQAILDEPISKHLPRGERSDPLRQLVRWSQKILAEHDINLVRADLGEAPANCAWVYGQGPPPALPAFAERYHVTGAVVAGTDLMRGLGAALGLEVIDVPGATGLPDTDLEAKAHAALDALERYDLVCVHVEAADEAGHLGDAQQKVAILERIDREIVAPLAARLADEPAHRILVMPDHPTPVALRRHTANPSIFLISGTGIASNRGEAFDEINAAVGELQVDRAGELMDYFLRR